MAIRSLTLSDTIGELVTEFNLQASDIGDMALLSTSDTSSLVNAIASLDSDLREQFGAVIDSAATINLITNPSNLSSIFSSGDFKIESGVIALSDSAGTIAITDDSTTNSSFNITLTDQTSGFETGLTVTSSKFTFNPSTGVLNVSKIEADSATITSLSSADLDGITSDSAAITTATIVNLSSNSFDADSATIGNLAFTSMNGGNIEADSATFTSVINAQDFNSTSDRSLKENIETLNDAINVVNKIRPVSFIWKEDGRGAYGVIAQEVEEVLPAIVDEDKDHIKRVAYSQLIPFLIQVIQQQDMEIQKIKKALNLD